jgi:hypothetical protein
MKRVSFALIMLLTVSVALAQAQEQTTPVVPFSTPVPLIPVTPDPNDARAAACSAYSLPDFQPYVVRPGDRLADLIANEATVTVTQVAALNCIDNPDALPVGSVIWLPGAPAEVTEGDTDAAAEIQSLSASADAILNTDTVTFSWSAAGERAYFYLCPVEECVRPKTAAALPVEGSISKGNFQNAGVYHYRLEVEGAGGPFTRDIDLSVTCAQEWLGGVGASPRCPSEPARTVFGVWQPFERGVMLWFSDVQQIYVMTDDGRFSVYEDQYVEGQPDPSDQAPSERFTPVRGFGQIWLALGGADSPLGWALTPEVGYDAARQAAGNTSYTTYVQGPASNVYAITEIPGMEQGWWSQVAW